MSRPPPFEPIRFAEKLEISSNYASDNSLLYEWTGTHWKAIDDAMGERMALKWIASDGRGTINAANARAAYQTAVRWLPMLGEPTDTAIIPVRNGYLHLNHGLVLKAHDKSLGLRHVLSCDFDPSAPAPIEFNTFMQRILPAAEVQARVQEYVGYTLLPDARYQRAQIWLGSGANGKGTLANLAQALHERTAAVQLDCLDGFRMASMVGASLIYCDEAPQRNINEQAMKSLIAGELDFVAYRDERLREVDSPNTVRLELALLSHLYTTAIKEWSWPLVHVMKDVKRPSPREGRERRLVADEELRLLEAARHESVRKPLWLEACIRIALETGLRACELLTLRWSQVDLSNGVVSLTKAINGNKRSVGLSYEATGLMNQLARDGERVVRGYFETGKLDCDFKAACVAAGIADLHFHDLRHEAASRFAPHMMPQELAKIMGWKTLQMAMRYYNPSAQEIAQRVRQVEASRAGSMPKPPMAPLGGEVRKVALQDGVADSLMSGRTVSNDEANVIRVAFGGSGVNRVVA